MTTSARPEARPIFAQELWLACQAMSRDHVGCQERADFLSSTECPNCGVRPQKLRCITHTRRLFQPDHHTVCGTCGNRHLANPVTVVRL